MATVLTPAEIKQKITDWITTNGQGDITGAHLNTILAAIMDYVGVGYAFMGEAPASAPSPDVPVAYLAGPGSYTGYDDSAVVVPEGSLGVFCFDGSEWACEQIVVTVDIGVTASTDTLAPQLSIEDEHGNTIVEFEDGDIKTKNFDSTQTPAERNDNTTSQLNIQDENGNNIAQFVDGDIRTKNFDSKNLRLPLKNKIISIVGDSISTFSGHLVSDKTGYQYAAYETKYPYQDIQSVEQTWWKQLLNETGARLGNLCAWSGSYVEGFSTFTDSAFYACSDRRISDIGFGGISPDIIIVLIGVNDYGVVNCQIGDFSDKSSIPAEGDQNNFSNAYALMIKKIITQYPKAKVFCCTILDVKNGYSTVDDTTYPELNNNGVSIYDINQSIIKICEILGCHLVDLHSCGINYFNSALYLPDGLHPNADGAKLIKNCIKKNLLNNL